MNVVNVSPSCTTRCAYIFGIPGVGLRDGLLLTTYFGRVIFTIILRENWGSKV